MNGLSKYLTILLLIVSILLSVYVGTSAISDNGFWEGSKLCYFLKPGTESNNDLNFAMVKVKYDRSINRIYLLFMMEFSDFNDENSIGVIMNFNGMGEVSVFADGTADYDSDVYFAQLDDELADETTMNVMFETTVGIKSGIPENIIMTVSIFDTNGAKSNVYNVDISEETEPDSETDEIAGNSARKTTKPKTSRTTKFKTQKTTKAKTTKAKSSKAKTEDKDLGENNIYSVDSGIESNVTFSNRRKKAAVILGIAATAAAVAGGCAAGIRSRKKDGGQK